MHATKSSGATRLVWRMTAEYRLGEILELPEESRSPQSRQSAGHPRGPLPRMASYASASSWRASSYDLLRGLSVRDVSEKIPQRAFEALFRPDVAAAGK